MVATTQLLIFSLLLIRSTLGRPSAAGGIVEVSVNSSNTTCLNFDPKKCTLGRTHSWDHVSTSNEPFPDLSTFVGDNSTDPGKAAISSSISNVGTDSLTQSAGLWSRGARPRSSSYTEVQHFGDKCTEEASYVFHNLPGYLRTTKPASIAEHDDYWFVWNFNQPGIVTVYRSHQEPMEDRWRVVYASPFIGDLKGWVHLEGGQERSKSNLRPDRRLLDV